MSEATLKRLAGNRYSSGSPTASIDWLVRGADHQDLRAAWLQLTRRCLLGSGHGTKGSFPIVPRRRCTAGSISRRTATSSRCRAGGNGAGPTCGCTRARQGLDDGRWPAGHSAFRDRLGSMADPGPGGCGADHCRRNPGVHYPGNFAETLAPHAAAFGRRRGDGLALLRWLPSWSGNLETSKWLEEARRTSAAAKAFAGSPPEDTERRAARIWRPPRVSACPDRQAEGEGQYQPMVSASSAAPDGIRSSPSASVSGGRGLDCEGATALLARDIGVRGTIDIDVYRDASKEVAESELRASAALDIGDWFRFEVGPARAVAMRLVGCGFRSCVCGSNSRASFTSTSSAAT